MNSINDKECLHAFYGNSREQCFGFALHSFCIRCFKISNPDIIILETSGIGQSGSEITEIADVSMYVMTPEYGASTS